VFGFEMKRRVTLDIDAGLVRWAAEQLKVDRQEAIRQILNEYMSGRGDAEFCGTYVIDEDGDLAVEYDCNTGWYLEKCPERHWPGGSVRWLP
jgi:hypothetical protein